MIMITEEDISKELNREIKSPIRVGNLNGFGIKPNEFLDYFKPFFNNLEDDLYLVRDNQIVFLKTVFPKDSDVIKSLHKSYFENKFNTDILKPWVDKLTSSHKEKFDTISIVTRQRNISSFFVEENKITRINESAFKQDVDDFRTWKRVFKQATAACVENEYFYALLKKIFNLVASIHPRTNKIKVTSHFMRTISKKEIKGENSPEGIHEDGVHYIISALVINRENITGAETQIYEQLATDKELIFNKELAPSEFVFQADTGEEHTFGNDLWHYVTPFQPINLSKRAIRDIIGFDMEIIA